MKEQYRHDVWVYRIIVLTLGLSMLSSLIGGILLAVNSRLNFSWRWALPRLVAWPGYWHPLRSTDSD